MTVPTAYKDEFLLLRWSDNSRDGMTVTFQIPGEYAEHPFKSSPTGKKTGKRYAAVLVEIGDDEKPVVQKGKPGPNCLKAIGLCRNESFQRWIGCGYEDDATDVMKNYLGVASRRELDTNVVAAAKFDRMVEAFQKGQRWMR